MEMSLSSSHFHLDNQAMTRTSSTTTTQIMRLRCINQNIALLCLAVLPFLVHLARAQQNLIQQGTVNLQTILAHQEALSIECAKFKTAKARELKSVLSYNANNDNNLKLAEPVPMKVPAICLLFLAASLDEQLAGGTNPKLELVNWIFDESDVKLNITNTPQLTKRQATQGSEVLSSYLLNPNYADNELAGVHAPTDEMHQNVLKLVADPRFVEGMQQSKNNLAAHLSPVILIPGLLGSRLQARTRKKTRVNIFCSKESDWQDMWLQLRMFLPIAVDCWLDNVRLELDPVSGFTKQPDGVEVRVPNFGSVESVRHLDLHQPKLTSYYQPLIEHYENLGYTANYNLLAAPYDFRLAPQQLSDFFTDLKNLVEQALATASSSKKVTLVCHSMGCTHALIFLRQQSPAWRQSRIRRLIALSSPWAGTAKALKALVVGDQLDLPLVSEAKMRKLARIYPSISYLLPQEEVFQMATKNHLETGGPILVRTPQKSYRVADLKQLLDDLGLSVQYNWFKVSSQLIKPLEPLPDVYVDCIHSVNIPTPETLVFRNQSDFPNGDYELISGDGDGTVNLQSLSVCENWAQQLPQRVIQKIILNTNHLGVLGHKITLDHITDDVMMS